MLFMTVVLSLLLETLFRKEKWECFWGATFIIRSFFWPTDQVLSAFIIAVVLINECPAKI